MSQAYNLGLIGSPLSHSISPILHSAMLSYSGLTGGYKLFDVKADELSDRFEELKNTVDGLNVTIPHKIKAIELVDEVSTESKLIGAINTIQFGTKCRGFNTDVHGFYRTIEGMDTGIQTTLLYGYGGASRAVILALVKQGVKKIYITGRSQEKLRQFVNQFKTNLPSSGITFDVYPHANSDSDLENDIEVDLLVNCSPLGQGQPVNNQFLVLLDELASQSSRSKKKLVYDLVYSKNRNEKTAVCQLAAERGLLTRDGFDMLVNQALESFKIWTGKEIKFEEIAPLLKDKIN